MTSSQQTDYTRMIRNQMLCLEKLVLGEITPNYLSQANSCLPRAAMSNSKNPQDWAGDYIRVVLSQNGNLNVKVDMSKLVIMLGDGQDRMAYLQEMKAALEAGGFQGISITPRMVSIDGASKMQRPYLTFSLPNTFDSVKHLGRVNQKKLLQKTREKYDVNNDYDAAIAFIKSHGHGYTAEMVISELDKYRKSLPWPESAVYTR